MSFLGAGGEGEIYIIIYSFDKPFLFNTSLGFLVNWAPNVPDVLPSDSPCMRVCRRELPGVVENE